MALERLARRIRRLLVTKMRERGLTPPRWLDEMSVIIAADLAADGKLRRSDIEEVVERAVEAWEDVLAFKRLAREEGRALRRKKGGG